MSNFLDENGLEYFYEKIKNKFAPKELVGKPSIAPTTAAMVNTNRVYVYTGTETGYTKGNWYYYDSSDNTWKSGGAYTANVYETDKTLSIEDVPADAKATGDEIADLKSAIFQNKKLVFNENGSVSWVAI